MNKTATYQFISSESHNSAIAPSTKVKSDNQALSLKSQKPPQLGLSSSNLTKASPLFLNQLLCQCALYANELQAGVSKGGVRAQIQPAPIFVTPTSQEWISHVLILKKKIKRILICNT